MSALRHPLDQQCLAWLEKIREGDERSFEALYRAFVPGLCALVARYVHAPDVAEELVQELFLTLWRRRAELEIQGSLTTYLYGAARNRALNWLQREQTASRWRLAIGETLSESDRSTPGEHELLGMLDLQEAIEHLPPRCKLIFTLHRQQGMSYGEIAESLGLSVRTVEAQMRRALQLIRTRLGRTAEE